MFFCVDWMGGYVCLMCIDYELDCFVVLVDDQCVVVEFVFGVCVGYVFGECYVLVFELLLFVMQEV